MRTKLRQVYYTMFLQCMYIKDHGLMGGMVFMIDRDDFNNVFCGQGEYPLTNALKRCLTTHTGKSNYLEAISTPIQSHQSKYCKHSLRRYSNACHKQNYQNPKFLDSQYFYCDGRATLQTRYEPHLSSLCNPEIGFKLF